METEFFIKHLLNLGLWIWIGVLFIPKARFRGRSPSGWFLIGLLSFYLPFFTLCFGPPLLTSHLTGQTSVAESNVLANVVLMSVLGGVTLGIYSVLHVRRILHRLPRLP